MKTAISNKLASIFRSPNDPPVKVRARRDMVGKINGESVHLSIGDELEILTSELRQHDGADFELLEGTKEPEVADPTPPKAEVAPLPNRWDKLPPCFSEWHALAEEFRTSRAWIDAICRTRRELTGLEIPVPRSGDFRHLLRISFAMADDRSNQNVFYDAKNIDTTDPVTRKISDFLETSLAHAIASLESLAASKGRKIYMLRLQCGLEASQRGEELNSLIVEADAIGREIFCLRIAALGLGESHTMKLYQGSRDAVKFSRFNGASITGVILGFDSDGQPIVGTEDAPMTSASLINAYQARIAEVKAAIAEGKRELAAARKVAA